MGWDHMTHNWQIYNALQTMIVNVRWMKGGKVLFKSVNFAGYIGVYNAVKQVRLSAPRAVYDRMRVRRTPLLSR